jgi:Alkylmercury lyase
VSAATLSSRVHCALLDGILRSGHALSSAQLAAATGATVDDVDAALGRLADEHGLLLHPGSQRRAVWIAHPFALSPTGTWVETRGGEGWWAPCLWCAFGIITLLERSVRGSSRAADADVHARLGAHAKTVTIAVRAGMIIDDGGASVVHFALPPRAAWDNVVHWCASVQPFAAEADVAAWCARHGYARGAVVPIAQVRDLGEAWYEDHLAPDWHKHNLREAQEIFARVGLTDPFWSLAEVGADAADERF